MPIVIAGQSTDLTKTVAVLVKELLYNNWPTAAFTPLRADVRFGTGTFDKYKDIHIHVNRASGESESYTIGGDYTKIIDPVSIHVYYRKNVDEVPDTLGIIQRKIEEIIRTNVSSLGQGITAILFDRWDDDIEEDNLKDVWHATGYARAIYWRVKT
jgi:hypothetical protein